jgi:hypothetical protein
MAWEGIKETKYSATGEASANSLLENPGIPS